MSGGDSVLQACARGDEAAWRQLVGRHLRLVRSVPLGLGLNPADADDVTQMTFAVLLRSLDKITDEARMGAWLVTVARRQTWRHLARMRREAPVATGAGPEPAGADPRDDRLVEDLAWLRQGLLRLDPRCSCLLEALYRSSQPRPYTEVAAELGLPTGSIGPTRARCLAKLRTVLDELDRV